MKALSIKQPWLYCITDLDKRVENRTWQPPAWIIGQRIALHASKSLDTLMSRRAASDLAGFKLSTVQADMPLGAIVATAVIAGVVTESDITESNRKWFFGPYGWLLADVEKLAGPIPARGSLGLWDWPIVEVCE